VPQRPAPDQTALAAELHDGVIANLTSLILEMEQFKREQYNRVGVQQAVSSFQSSTRSALAQLRDIVHGVQIGPSDLDGGLVEALRSGPLLELRQRQGVSTRIVMSPSWPRNLDVFTALHLYRIVEQALRNVAEHSQARHVQVALRTSVRNLLVEVIDDGIGFRWSNRVNGQGVAGMEQRALLLGGTLEVADRPRRGAAVRVTVPWS
jgi:two-component system sensor histidine kinase UhpB